MEVALKIVIIDDHDLFTEGLTLLLSHRFSDLFTVVGTTSHPEEAPSLIARCQPDIAIVDLNMPPLGGPAVIRYIKARRPEIKVLALSGANDVELAESALHAGADGYLSKTSRPDDLLSPLRILAAGLRVVDPELLDHLLRSSRKPPQELLDRLTSQDLNLWQLLATGMETIDIAQRMLVSERTAKRMIAALLNKIGAGNRIAAAAMAGSLGVLNDGDGPTVVG
ncbi:response regulator transcription factor [Nocardia wallacei]|uniref:response regulator transcription factor n=1 Tax=Nocardia wallacei TaxID=480035 RepID=UPI00245841FD|nr:response regulator transcription factor [Nocardia wallacei]